MKTLILYYSKYGTTKKCAQMLADKIDENADIVGYKQRKNADIDKYDTVIIGAPVYMGMLKKMKSFCEANLSKLQAKKVGLFVCHMDVDKPMEEKIVEYFPKALIDHSSVVMSFGGAYDTDKMKKFDKFIFEKVAKEKVGSTDKVNYDAIDKFAAIINQ